MADAVHFEVQAELALLRIDDGKVNALTPALVEAALVALDRAKAEAKALLVLGRPGCFSAGFDLRVLLSGPEQARALLSRGAELFLQLYEHPQPTIAAVSGHALAGGALLSAACDLRIGAAGEFQIGLNEVAAGMPLPVLAHEFARDRLDPRRLIEATLFARIYDPTSAAKVGWLDEVVEPDALEAAALAAAARLAKLPAGPYARTKASVRRRTIDHIRATLADNISGLGS